jgi:hypothetical protein
MLGQLNRQCSEAERPLLTAITVQKSGERAGEPGPGFYDAAISLNKIPKEWDALRRLKWAGEERERVWQHWQNR